MYTQKKRHQHTYIIELVCFCALPVINMVTCFESPCTAAVGNSYPRISLCSGINFVATNKTEVVLDSFDASNNNTVKSCTCIAKAVYPGINKIEYSDLLLSSSTQRNCGSSIVFSQNFSQLSKHSCVVNGTLNINVTKAFNIMLDKDYPISNTEYCLHLFLKSGNIMTITCNNVTFWNNNSESTEYQKTEHHTTDYHTTDKSTVDIINDSDRMHVDEKIEDFNTLYIGIGGGVIGMLLLTVSVVCLVKQFRKKKTPPRADDGVHEDDDEYSLQYNTLYVSSDDVLNNHTEDISGASRPDGNLTYQVAGNYSEISLNEMPNDSAGNVSASYAKERSKYGINIDGDYAAIDMDENVASAIKIDIKSSANENRVEEDRKRVIGDLDIEHVISPGENGCEYAIVQKDRYVDDQNNVYAVVDKTRKKE